MFHILVMRKKGKMRKQGSVHFGLFIPFCSLPAALTHTHKDPSVEMSKNRTCHSGTHMLQLLKYSMPSAPGSSCASLYNI